MPRSLLDRCGIDCIAEFRAAARKRFDEAEALAAKDHRLGGIYLCGYAAEMTVKATYFSFLGYTLHQAISIADLKAAASKAVLLGTPVFPNLHHVECWGRLLIAERFAAAKAYPGPFVIELLKACQTVQRHWRETLRYRKNQAYSFELEQVRVETLWMLNNV